MLICVCAHRGVNEPSLSRGIGAQLNKNSFVFGLSCKRAKSVILVLV